MTAAASPAAGPVAPRRRRAWIAGLVALAVAAAAVVLALRALADDHGTGSASPDAGPLSTAAIERRSLTAVTTTNGTLGYGTEFPVLGSGGGVLTRLPAVGQVIRAGQELYEVDGKPVVLLYGSRPAWRELAAGTTAADVTGPDVRQLNAALVALGLAKASDLDPTSDEFTWATTAGVERLQARFGLKQTGTLALGSVVFLPTAIRVTSLSGQLGAAAGGPIAKATSTDRRVTVNLPAAQQGVVHTGEAVQITLPDGRSVPGTVTSVGTVASTGGGGSGGGSGGATVPLTITPTSAAATGRLDQAPVQVQITTQRVNGVLAVPVAGLLALAGGGYAVEVVGAAGAHRLVAVTPGLFDDDAGLVQVTGSGVAAGTRVVVPAS